MKTYAKQKGFSLVELAITIVIVGLMVAGVTSGLHLMQAAKINQVISEITGYTKGVENFRLKYNALPGDFPVAASIWGAYAAGPPITGAHNGNGDEQISGDLTESLYAWRHLVLANMIIGDYSGADAGTPDYIAGTNVPSSQAYEGRHYFLSKFNNIFNTYGNILQFGSNQTDTKPWGASLTPADANIIDGKIDDGAPTTGDVFFFRGDEYAAINGSCVDDTWDAASANAILTDNTVSCRLIVWLTKN